ncbi:type II toxin-antitoxin system HicB family antitoxin [Salmonella enterica]|nr:type II toxin-antitoxin system HicB family antitoxin [Salmonella enterica]EAO0118533.1 type II toxin-antitoxin system HicB family antitoxin [Salmonella enterica]EAO3601637.1 type II toxin-antitoxin system HicB family antitoxin [Salmonella enterica]EAR6391531.1 type II toxin-antitoxin system HicB family antitoxin [Salmonella enterica]EAV1285295.1 type II toxin-antitoxin system HicB family antitoxin [Salmonella enterica]
MNYAINYKKAGRTYKGTFPDFPDITVTADTPEDLQAAAYDALIGKLMSYMENGVKVPLPLTEPNPSYVALLPSIVTKVLLHNLVVDHNKSRSWVASQMGVTRQVMTRLFNLRETTKVETIQNALDTLGYDMKITVEPKPNNLSV